MNERQFHIFYQFVSILVDGRCVGFGSDAKLNDLPWHFRNQYIIKVIILIKKLMKDNEGPSIEPKLLLEFYKGQTVPRLVSKHDRHSTPAHNDKKQRRERSQHSVNSIHSKRTVEHKPSQNDIENINRLLESQRLHNSQLRQIIKQLTAKSDHMKQINEDLLIRIKELQITHDELVRNYSLEKNHQEQKIKTHIYQRIESYLQIMVDKFTQTLSQHKMSPMVQQSIETFLQELLQINPISVEHEQKRIKNQSIKIDTEEVNQTIQELIENESKSHSRITYSKPNNYQNIFRQLQQIQRSSQENTFDPLRSIEKTQMKEYGTPQRLSKRPKIFNKKYVTEFKGTGRMNDLQL